VIEQEQPDLFLVGRNRVDIDERARELKQIHSNQELFRRRAASFEETARRAETTSR
jgi:hypothetical protein